MGVWIEIAYRSIRISASVSLPAWECGLKSVEEYKNLLEGNVTPCVGVWIEMGSII